MYHTYADPVAPMNSNPELPLVQRCWRRTGQVTLQRSSSNKQEETDQDPAGCTAGSPDYPGSIRKRPPRIGTCTCKNGHHCSAQRPLAETSDVENMVEVGDVADGQAKDLDLGELLVRRQGGQQSTQLGERHVEGLDSDPLSSGMRQAVLLRGPAATSPVLAAQGHDGLVAIGARARAAAAASVRALLLGAHEHGAFRTARLQSAW